MKIPKLFHTIWLGPKSLSKDFKYYRKTWSMHHPGWEFMDWNDGNLPEIINSHEFAKALNYAQQSDILKYELIWRFGGIYIDSDFECVKNIESLVSEVEIFSASEKPPLISVGIFGAIKQHVFFKEMIEALPVSFKNQDEERQDLSTGPGLMTKVAEDHPEYPIKIFGPKLFYPYHFTEMHRKDEEFPEAYAVHHWSHSWIKKKIKYG